MSSESNKPTSSFELQRLLDALNNSQEDIENHPRQFQPPVEVREAAMETSADQPSDIENRFAKNISEAMAKSNWHCDANSIFHHNP